MSIPALRKPKFFKELANKKIPEQQYIILTLKNEIKLVISSDSFHGIIMIGTNYKCVFCDVEIENQTKELHKCVDEHKKFLKKFSYAEEFSENLIREINKLNCYCTICNVTTATVSVMLHIRTEKHVQELNRAIIRASAYKPVDENNNK